jgi:bifunctional non-homologous end joining protein LigD
LFAFDLVELDGLDLRREPIEARKAALAKLLHNVETGIVYEHTQGDGAEIFAHACRFGLRGHRGQTGGFVISVRSIDRSAKLKNPESTAVRRERELRRT